VPGKEKVHYFVCAIQDFLYGLEWVAGWAEVCGMGKAAFAAKFRREFFKQVAVNGEGIITRVS
jgi:hypothetical protein